jgi:fructose-bisphosphate aldolase class I
MNDQDMLAKIKDGQGFVAALDQSGGSTPQGARRVRVAADAWSSEEEMYGLIHDMRVRSIGSPAVSGRQGDRRHPVRTHDGRARRRQARAAGAPRQGGRALHQDRQGLEDEEQGVQLMKPMPDLDALLSRSRAHGVFGTKERSVINLANREGIAAIVRQQFEIARQVLGAGLMPIIEPEVNIRSAERAEADGILLDELTKALDAMPGDAKVMLKLSLPAKPGLFTPLTSHPRVLRVVALSGGFARPEACSELARNPGVIASFSRALLEDLRHGMSEAEFDEALGEAVDTIFEASTVKS